MRGHVVIASRMLVPAAEFASVFLRIVLLDGILSSRLILTVHLTYACGLQRWQLLSEGHVAHPQGW